MTATRPAAGGASPRDDRAPLPAGGRRLRVLHSRAEIAGQIGLSVEGLREIGHDARGAYPPTHFRVQPDLAMRPTGRWRKGADMLWKAVSTAGRFDVYHYHYALSLLPEGCGFADARVNRRLGKVVAVEFWGSDVRMPGVEAERNPYYVNSYAEDDRRSRERMRRWAEITGGHVIIVDHYFDAFMEPYFPHIHVVGQRVDTRRLQPSYPSPEARLPVVVHAPSQRAFKGTEHVQRAVERLKAKGLRFEYVEVHGVANEEALRIYQRADLIVDQLCGGSHGVFAVEALSLGKPVMCHILPELVPTYPEGFPIINANPHTIEAVLEDWLQRPEDRYRLGVQGREYAERVHDHRVVAARLVDVYRLLGA